MPSRIMFNDVDVKAIGKRDFILNIKVAVHGYRAEIGSKITSKCCDLRDETAYGIDCRTKVASVVDVPSDSEADCHF